MKRVFLVSLGLLIFAFMGCVSINTDNAIIYDPSFPAEQLSYVAVPNYIRVTCFNGNNVTWQGTAMQVAIVGIPAGMNTLIYDYIQPGVGQHNNRRVIFEFEAGVTYYMRSAGDEIRIDRQ